MIEESIAEWAQLSGEPIKRRAKAALCTALARAPASSHSLGWGSRRGFRGRGPGLGHSAEGRTSRTPASPEPRDSTWLMRVAATSFAAVARGPPEACVNAEPLPPELFLGCASPVCGSNSAGSGSEGTETP